MKMMPLFSLGRLRNGMNYDKSSVVNGCKIIGVADFGHRVFPDYDSLSEIDASILTDDDLLHNGDILFVRSNGNKNLVGRSMFIKEINEAVCYSGFCISFRPNQDLVFPEYLFYALRSPFCRKQYSYSQQTNITNLSQTVLCAVQVPIPQYNKQKKLVKILADLDQKISLNTRICAELGAMAKTLYEYWFVQFDFPDENGQPYRSSGGKMVWNEQLKRKIPKGWSVGNLYDIATFINGIACQKYRPIGNEDSLPVIKIKEMHEGISDQTETVSTNIPAKQKINNGDILFSWSATLEVMYWYGGAGGLNQHIFKVIPSSYFSKEYVYYQLSEYVIMFGKMAEARKTTMGHITTDHLEQSRIALPSKDCIEAFSKIVSPIHRRIGKSQIENRELEKLRDWLLPMLMNGQATVSSDNVNEEAPNKPKTKAYFDQRFDLWLKNQGLAARGDVDKKTLRSIFDVMDDDDK